jgi:two-component system, NtrC family, response regulator AtoC
MTAIDQRNDQQQMREFVGDGLHGDDWRLVASSPARRWAASHFDIEVLGRSQAFIDVIKQVERVSNNSLPVLLTGESGTGKAIVASAIHHRSSRADQPFITVNCGAMSAESIEAELFGHAQAGDGGTVFLTEITQITPPAQARLLRIIQVGEIRSDASEHTRKVNVRVIAASDRDIEQEVAAGRFRSDLYSRLNALSIVLPPLRKRPEDIAPLAQSIADRIYSLNPPVKFAPDALALLERYSWPGNIRELENVVVRAVALCDGAIRARDLPQRVRNHSPRQADAGTSQSAASDVHAEEWVPLSEIEGRYVAQVLEHTRGNKQAAARVLAVDRKTLDRMIKRHHIDSGKARRRQ